MPWLVVCGDDPNVPGHLAIKAPTDPSKTRPSRLPHPPQTAKMTPTPSPHSTFTSFRFRPGQTARPFPYDHTRNPIVNPPAPATPVLNDEGTGDQEEGLNNEGEEDEDDVEEDIEEGAGNEDDDGEEEGGIEEVPMEIDQPFDPASLGLKEIGNLASWTVSSCKPGCGVDALRDEDTALFWQSDGPQPHHLNIHFSRLVSVLRIRLFLDFDADESYTPTRITLLAGTGYHDLIPFHALTFEQPRGWIDVLPEGQGDDSGIGNGGVLRCFLLQVRIVENHQNGKDTHVRGLKVYAAGDKGSKVLDGLGNECSERAKRNSGAGRGWLVEPDWMGEPELR